MDSVFDRQNPTMDDAIAKVRQQEQAALVKGDVRPVESLPYWEPRPDREWVPLLYKQFRSLPKVASVAHLPVAKVRQILVEAKVRIKGKVKFKPKKSA